MVADPEGEPAQQPRQPAPVLLAVGVMVAIALVAAGAVLAWARLAAPTSAEQPSGLTEELPGALPDGSPFGEVPPPIAAVAVGPVVAAARLDAPLEDFEECTGDPTIENLEFEAGFVTPDGAVQTATGESENFGPGELTPVRASCTFDWAGGVWQHSGGGLDMLIGGGGGIGTMGGADGWWVSTATLDLPEGTAWVVQDRGGYRLAYAVDDLAALPLTWRYRQNAFGRGSSPSTSVLLLDSEGDVLEETVVGV
jgi:hypothetical protein